MFGKFRGTGLKIKMKQASRRLLLSLFLVIAGSGFLAPSRAGAQFSNSTSLQQPGAAVATDIATLELGKPLDQEISGGQRHRYTLTLTRGEFMRIEIKAEVIDLGVVLHLPDGRSRQLYQPFGGIREMAVGEVAESSGTYSLDVYPTAKAAPGRYRIELVAVHTATAQESALQEARDLFTQSFGLHKQGRNSEALPLMARSLEIREKELGPNHLLVAITAGSLGNINEDLGNYAAAESLFLRELRIKEQALGPDDPQVADTLTQMGSYYENKGDYVQAEEAQQKVLAIYHKRQLDESAFAAAALAALGSINYERGDYAGAAKYYEQSRVVWQKLLGADHFHMASSYTQLGRVAYDAGDYSKAEAMFQKALTLTEKGIGTDHPGITGYLNDLGMLYCTTGDYDKGEALYLRAISINEQKSSIGRLTARDALYGIARCYAGQGRAADAAKFEGRASETEERYITLNLAVGSEREKLAMLGKVAAHLSRNISLHTMLAAADPAARDLAALSILQRKGRLQDAMSASLDTLRQRSGPEDRKLLDQYNESTTNLANLVLDGPPRTMTDAAYQKQIKDLEGQKETIEAEISRWSSGSFAVSAPVTLAAVQAAIPAAAALLEFAVYQPFDAKAPDNSKAYGAPRYVAYIFKHEGEVQWKDLGDAGEIDAAVSALRRSLRNPDSRDVRQRARALEEKVIQPLQTAIGAARQLLISADGELNLVPMGALVDTQGSYLLQHYSIGYLTSGRDLLRLQVSRQSKSAPVVLADPAYGEPALVADRIEAHRTGSPKAVEAPRIDSSQIFFGPLPGANEEVRALRETLPNATFILREEATKAALEQVVAPSILHIATHGFFLSESGAESKPTGAVRTRGVNVKAKIDNPLLRSGLALTGANRHDESGILTALEASGLNLWGTKLVVLSACDTGLGEVRNGEGVYGLRRALVLAGSETQMISLWPVSDRSTRDLMIAFYRNLVKGSGRGEALRQAQLQMLQDKSHGHPYYWASFIQTGEWANLEGKR